MKENKFSNWRTNLRIVWAITAKDILEAVKNRYSISVVIVALLVGVLYSFIPALTSLDNPTNVLVYDAAHSPLGAQLKSSQALEVYTYPSEQIMLEKLSRGEVPELGLVIPANFDPSATTGEGSQIEPALIGYALYWVSDAEIAKMTQEVKTEIDHLVGKPVEIRMAEDRLIPAPNDHTLGNWVGAALVYLMIYIGLGLISNQMLEEKQTRTLEVLLVSPASSWHFVLAKALTGLFYCLLGIAVTLAINQKIVLHWWVIVPTLIVGSLFSISLGLIAGSMVEERGQLSLWTFGLLIPLFVPVFLSILDELFPQWINQVISLIPTVTFFHLLQDSFSFVPPTSMLLKQFALLSAWTIAGLAVAIWIMHRQQQKVAGDRDTPIKKVGNALRPRFHTYETVSTSALGAPASSTSYQGVQALVHSPLTIRPPSWLRIVQTIAAKDIRQSIHNKLILSILLGTVFLVAGNALLLRGLSAYTGSQASLSASSSPVLAIMISITLMALGVALVPLLMVEEKEAHTLETLLVSPARYTQVMVGKALAGSAYCLSGVLVILIAYHFLIVHWELALLALLLGTVFIVGLGLLVGMISKNPTTIGMWAAVIMLILIIPAILAGLAGLGRVPWIEAVMTYWPSTSIVKLFNLAMLAETPPGVVMANVFSVASAAIVLYLVTWWLVRRSDR